MNTYFKTFLSGIAAVEKFYHQYRWKYLGYKSYQGIHFSGKNKTLISPQLIADSQNDFIDVAIDLK